MAIQGLRLTSNFVADERPKNWREGILLRYPNGKAPLTALTAGMKERVTDDPEYSWWEKELDNRRLQLSADCTSGDTTVSVVDKAKSVKAGDLLYAEKSGEIMMVTADPISDTSVPVSRAIAGTSQEAVISIATENPFLTVIGSAYEEASAAPTGVNFDPTKLYNYTQIFRNTLEMSRTAMKTRLRTGDQIKEAKREVAELHSIDMERAFWFGKKSETTLNGKPQRTTDGVFARIDSNNIVDNAGADMDMETLEGYLERAFRYGSSEKMAFCGNLAMLGVQQIIRKNSTFNIQSGLKEYGMNVSRLICPFGELVIKTHPLWNQMTSKLTATAYYSLDSWFCILDMDQFRYVYLKDSDTKYEQKLQENGLDGEKSGWITECGTEISHAKNHFLIKGIVGGKADT